MSTTDLGLEASPFERVVESSRRPGYSVVPVAITWDAVAFGLHGERDAVACIPRPALAAFFEDLDAGRLDEPIRDFLASPSSGRVLRAADQTTNPGLFDELASPEAIVPAERSPGRPGLLGRGGGTPTNDRRNKRSRKPRPRRVFVGAAVAVAVVAAGAIAFAASRGGDNKDAVTAGPDTTAPTPTVPTPTAPAIPLLAAVAGSYSVTEVYTGCGTSDHTIADATITILVDEATRIITVGVSKATGPLDGTTFRVPTAYQSVANPGTSVPTELIGTFDVSGPTPRLHIEASPDITGTGRCHVTYDGTLRR
ncbi:MAG: hypothetical protein QOI95_4150 [Acidimicrobiaceae bacterium]|jgi:hypothetical protein